MGLQYNVQVLREDGTVVGFSADFLRENYGSLTLITGMLPERVSQEGWSQLVSTQTAATFLRQFGQRDDAKEFEAEYEGELVRITIA